MVAVLLSPEVNEAFQAGHAMHGIRAFRGLERSQQASAVLCEFDFRERMADMVELVNGRTARHLPHAGDTLHAPLDLQHPPGIVDGRRGLWPGRTSGGD